MVNPLEPRGNNRRATSNKGPFIATQLNSTQLDVELSTRSQREQLSPISSERRDPARVSIGGLQTVE